MLLKDLGDVGGGAPFTCTESFPGTEGTRHSASRLPPHEVFPPEPAVSLAGHVSVWGGL